MILSLLFKSGEIIKRIGTTSQSIRRWVNRYPDLFSANAKEDNRYKVFYTPEDVFVMLSIKYLSAQGYGLDEIGDKLRDGYRYEDEKIISLLERDASKRGVLIADIDAPQLQAELQQLRKEYAQSLADAHEWKTQYESKNQEVANLMREIANLQYRLGAAEAELNLLRRQQGQ